MEMIGINGFDSCDGNTQGRGLERVFEGKELREVLTVRFWWDSGELMWSAEEEKDCFTEAVTVEAIKQARAV
jgi:hypothetical protein